MENHTDFVSKIAMFNLTSDFLEIEKNTESGTTVICEYKNGSEFGKQTWYRE